VTVPVLMTAATLASSPPPLPGFLNALASPLQHYGIWAIGLLIMLEDFGIPVPGETILIGGAIYAGAGRLNIVAVGVVGFIAAVIGDNIGFAIGHFGGRALALRWGKYVFLTEERLDKAEGFFHRHGGKVIAIARFVEGLRQANGIIAGIAGMRWRRFLAFNALGAALWVGTWVSLGYLAGQHIATIYHYITVYSYYALIAVAVLLVAYVTLRLLRRRRGATAAASTASRADETHDIADETHDNHDNRDTSEAAGFAPGDPGRGAHASPGDAAGEHPPAGHQHTETAPGEHVAPGHARDDHAPDAS
jgi:membrane protein DedA with SNARE-associated domain